MSSLVHQIPSLPKYISQIQNCWRAIFKIFGKFRTHAPRRAAAAGHRWPQARPRHAAAAGGRTHACAVLLPLAGCTPSQNKDSVSVRNKYTNGSGSVAKSLVSGSRS